MSNLAFLEYISRIKNALALDQLEGIVEELKRAAILPGMHSDLAPEALTENIRNERLLGLFQLIMDSEEYGKITPYTCKK